MLNQATADYLLPVLTVAPTGHDHERSCRGFEVFSSLGDGFTCLSFARFLLNRTNLGMFLLYLPIVSLLVDVTALHNITYRLTPVL